MTSDAGMPSIIDHPTLGRLEVLDDSDPSLLTVRNESGATLRIGKKAAGWTEPAYKSPAQGAPSMREAPAAAPAAAPPDRPPAAADADERAAGGGEVPRPETRQSPAGRAATGAPARSATQPRRPRMETKVLEFTIERETKNTVRYEEQTDGQPPAVGTLYVQKWALGTPAPQRLRITVEAVQ